MTTKLLFASRRAGLLGWHPRPHHAPFRRVPLLVALAAILLSASTPRLDASATARLDSAPIALPQVGLAETGPTRTRTQALPAGSIDALVTMLARKYRVSEDATRELVDAAYSARTNIHVGARALKEYIRRGGTEIAGLQLYNGSLDDESNAYAHKVLLEKQRLQSAIRRRT